MLIRIPHKHDRSICAKKEILQISTNRTHAVMFTILYRRACNRDSEKLGGTLKILNVRQILRGHQIRSISVAVFAARNERAAQKRRKRTRETSIMEMA